MTSKDATVRDKGHTNQNKPNDQNNQAHRLHISQIAERKEEETDSLENKENNTFDHVEISYISKTHDSNSMFK